MSEQKMPKNVAEIIVAARARLEQEARVQQIRQQEEQQAMISKGRQLFDEYVKQHLQNMPDWLRKYADQDLEDVERLERLGRGWEKCAGSVRINVPGLAPILFDWEKGYYKAAYVSWYEYEDEAPKWTFRDSHWKESLDYVLVAAQNTFVEMQEKMKQYEQLHQEREERARECAKRQEETEREAEARAEKKRLTEQSEENRLLAILREDPVAVLLMKAFVVIRQERSVFEEQIAEADEIANTIEQQWSRKADDLRRQAKDAEHCAEDERRRASDLEDDLQTTKKKLKQAERGL